MIKGVSAAIYMPVIPWGRVAEVYFNFEKKFSKGHVFPLIQVGGPFLDPLTRTSQFSLNDYIELMLKSLSSTLPEEISFGLEQDFIDDVYGNTSCSTYVHLLAEIHKTHKSVVPVLSNLASLSQNIETMRFVRSMNMDRVILKFRQGQQDDNQLAINDWFSQLFSSVDFDRLNLDVVLDLGYVGGWSPVNAINGAEEWIRLILSKWNWNSVFVLGTSIPSGLCSANTLGFPILRNEWIIFKSLSRRLRDAFSINYADNAIFGPGLSCVVNGNQHCVILPYTIEDEFYVFHRLNIKDDTANSFKGVLNRLLLYPGVFKGRNFSFGDSLLEDMSNVDGMLFENSVSTYVLAALLDHHICASTELLNTANFLVSMAHPTIGAQSHITVDEI